MSQCVHFKMGQQRCSNCTPAVLRSQSLLLNKHSGASAPAAFLICLAISLIKSLTLI